jgi:hypothetical protein
MLPLILLLMLATDDIHESVLLDGVKIGTCHTTRVPDGPNIRTTNTLDLTLRRYGAEVRLRMQQGDITDREGAILGVFMRQGIPPGKTFTLEGVVKPEVKTSPHGDVALEVTSDGRGKRQIPWPNQVRSLHEMEKLFADGKSHDFFRYEPLYNRVLLVRCVVKEKERVEVNGTPLPLLRVELLPDVLVAGSMKVQPSKAVLWLDEQGRILRRQMELDGTGTLILVRTNKEQSRSGVTGLDIGKRSLIALNRGFPNPYATTQVVYRLTIKDSDEAQNLVISDAHQEVRNAKGDTFELVVHPVKRDAKSEIPKPEADVLGTSHYIDHQQRSVLEATNQAVGSETDPWRKALRIEKWLKSRLRNDASAELESASRTLQTMRGDCRHHAMALTAMARAAGIPARTAIGLLYVYRDGPKLGFHMWSEVYIDGKWLGLDSTLGRGAVSGTHLKIAEHSWDKVESLAPLLPLTRVIGRMKVAVIKVD